MLNVFLGISIVLSADAGISVEPPVPQHKSRQIDNDIARAARQYRLQVYETFRSDRQQFDDRQQACWDVLDDWRAGGEPAKYKEQVLAWFSHAAQASQADEILELPQMVEIPVVTPPQDYNDSGDFEESNPLEFVTNTLNALPSVSGPILGLPVGVESLHDAASEQRSPQGRLDFISRDDPAVFSVISRALLKSIPGS